MLLVDLSRMVEDVLQGIELYSPEAHMLLLGTAGAESNFGLRIYQIGGGPARGIYQMEWSTDRSLWNDFLLYRPRLSSRIVRYLKRTGPGNHLVWDMGYQTAMARVKYLTIPEPLPKVDDVEGMARYWKLYYNTPLGAGKRSKFEKIYRGILESRIGQAIQQS